MLNMIDNDQNQVEILNEVPESDFATPEKQKARTFLRERFLRVVTGVVGKRARFHLHENTKVAAEFRGCDVDCLELFTRNLETPLGKVPEAILRSTDVILFEIDGIPVQQ